MNDRAPIHHVIVKKCALVVESLYIKKKKRVLIYKVSSREMLLLKCVSAEAYFVVVGHFLYGGDGGRWSRWEMEEMEEMEKKGIYIYIVIKHHTFSKEQFEAQRKSSAAITELANRSKARSRIPFLFFL